MQVLNYYDVNWRVVHMIIYLEQTPIILLEMPDRDYYVLDSFLHEYPRKCRRQILQCAGIVPLTIDVKIVKTGRNRYIKTVQQRVIVRDMLPALISTLQCHRYNCYVCTIDGMQKITKK